MKRTMTSSRHGKVLAANKKQSSGGGAWNERDVMTIEEQGIKCRVTWWGRMIGSSAIPTVMVIRGLSFSVNSTGRLKLMFKVN